MEKQIRVMTFNVRNSEGDRGTVHDWENRKEKVRYLIRKYNPDVIGLQEVLEDQLDYLAGTLPDYQYKGVGRDDGVRAGEFNPIFYRDQALEVEESGTFWLSDTPDICSNPWSWCPRICTWINFRKPVPFVFYNTHFDERDSSTRLKSVSVIIKGLEINSPARPAILAGDFNFERNSEEYERIRQHFRDACTEEQNYDLLSRVTYHGFKGTRKGNRSIDFVFIRGSLTVNEIGIIYDNVGGVPSTYPSDHWPIFADLEIVF
ncbi:MAG: endonuclease/exonuclease/phosphatase family protein [Candidatus Odinarchaeota archaeon]